MREGEMEVTATGPAGSNILFIIFISEFHDTAEGKCNVESISFADDATWRAKRGR